MGGIITAQAPYILLDKLLRTYLHILLVSIVSPLLNIEPSLVSYETFKMGSVGINTTHHLYPPFPTDITTAPLVSISLSKLEAGDQVESNAFYEAAKNLGFFYMKLEGSSLGERIVDGAERLHKIQQEFFKRPNDEKEEFAREKIDQFFGYRKVELSLKNDDGTPRRNETYNVSRFVLHH
jgi:hypothetical protein